MIPTRSALSLLVLLPAPGLAEDFVPLQGVLRALQPGDIACYAELEVNGEAHSLLADFSLCEESEALIGKPVRLAWKEAQVLAADCQGDMDCGRSDTVNLIDRMQLDPASPSCAQGEATAFQCAVGARQVAVCHSAGGRSGSWLQYRFGRPGQTPELIWPEYPADPVLSAEGRVESYAGGGASWLRFRRGDHAYVVYTGIGRWGDNGETREQSGVVVERRGEIIADLRCSGSVRSELGPEWFESVGVEAVDEAEFTIPGPSP